MNTQVNGQPASWSPDIWQHWNAKIAPIFKKGETCSSANYFTPRPYRNEYDRGSNKYGFVYIVMPDYRVCIRDWSDRP